MGTFIGCVHLHIHTSLLPPLVINYMQMSFPWVKGNDVGHFWGKFTGLSTSEQGTTGVRRRGSVFGGELGADTDDCATRLCHLKDGSPSLWVCCNPWPPQHYSSSVMSSTELWCVGRHSAWEEGECVCYTDAGSGQYGWLLSNHNHQFRLATLLKKSQRKPGCRNRGGSLKAPGWGNDLLE